MDYNINDILPYVENYTFDEYFSVHEEDFLISAIDCEKTPDFDWGDGASKLVIIPFDTDYVIKIPFNSNHNEFGATWEAFYTQDYCEKEVELYDSLAENENPIFLQFFLPLTRVKEFQNWEIYIQPKCEIYDNTDKWDRQNSYSKNSMDMVKSNACAELSSLPEDWLAAVAEVLQDIGLVKEFIHILEEYGINQDLHRGNIGYCNGKPIILDYGGFDD